MKRSQKKKVMGLVRTILLTGYLLLVVLPIYWMVVTSLKTSPEIINAQEITYFPRVITGENYASLFSMLDYGTYLYNSVLITVTTAVCVVFLSVLGGYGLARFTFKGKSSVLMFFLLTQMIPGILVMIPLYVVFSRAGLINTHFALFLFYTLTNLPFCVITMRSFFERIPYVLEEAAYVDGCGRWQALARIVLPVMFPGIVAVFVFAFIGAWNELIAGTIFINTPDMWTIPVGLKSLIGKYNVQWGALMSGGVLALLPTAIMFVFVQKYVVEGLTSGAVKG